MRVQEQDLALNNPQDLIWHKMQPDWTNVGEYHFIHEIFFIHSVHII